MFIWNGLWQMMRFSWLPVRSKVFSQHRPSKNWKLRKDTHKVEQWRSNWLWSTRTQIGSRVCRSTVQETSLCRIEPRNELSRPSSCLWIIGKWDASIHQVVSGILNLPIRNHMKAKMLSRLKRQAMHRFDLASTDFFLLQKQKIRIQNSKQKSWTRAYL